jgi:hypothetical protein
MHAPQRARIRRRFAHHHILTNDCGEVVQQFLAVHFVFAWRRFRQLNRSSLLLILARAFRRNDTIDNARAHAEPLRCRCALPLILHERKLCEALDLNVIFKTDMVIAIRRRRLRVDFAHALEDLALLFFNQHAARPIRRRSSARADASQLSYRDLVAD